MSLSTIASSLIVFAVGQTSTITDTLREEQTRLNDCIQKIEEAPLEAYEDALAWLNEGSRPGARYCAALSLSALGHYEEAAARLEFLAKAKDAGSLGDRAVFLTQAGNAWMAAGLPDQAINALTEALKITQTDPDIYKDRAAARIAADQPLLALDDLNEALTYNPVDAEAYRMRALSYLQQDQPAYAMQDIETSMQYDGKNIDTLVLRGEVREALRKKRKD